MVVCFVHALRLRIALVVLSGQCLHVDVGLFRVLEVFRIALASFLTLYGTLGTISDSV